MQNHTRVPYGILPGSEEVKGTSRSLSGVFLPLVMNPLGMLGIHGIRELSFFTGRVDRLFMVWQSPVGKQAVPH